MSHRYVATKSQLTFQLENRFSDLVFECDFRRNDRKEQLIQTALDRCSGAVQARLLAELKAAGEVLWTGNVYITRDGLKIVDEALKIDDAAPPPRIIPFADIGDLEMKDNQLKICMSGDALPFLVLPNDATNFIPLLALFTKLTAVSHDIKESAADEPMENLEVATAD